MMGAQLACVATYMTRDTHIENLCMNAMLMHLLMPSGTSKWDQDIDVLCKMF